SLLLCSPLFSSFLSCYADHRALHSFPTRRSSDLPGSSPSSSRSAQASRGARSRSRRRAWPSPAPRRDLRPAQARPPSADAPVLRSEEHTSELQSRENLVCRLLLEKKKNNRQLHTI